MSQKKHSNTRTPIEATCKDCQGEFTITVDEQISMMRKGFDLPKRCPNCRKLRKSSTTISSVCVKCHEPFAITSGEVVFYSNRGLELPKKCPQCREISRKAKNGQINTEENK